MDEQLADPAGLDALVEQWGSPVNLIDPRPLVGHAAELVDAGATAGVDVRVFFARKANKALAVVEAALGAGHGVDVASERELEQVLARPGAAPDRVILTAGVKPRALLGLAVASGVTVSVDNRDELDSLVGAAADAGVDDVPVALRLAPQVPGRPPSRFGLPADEIADLLCGASRWRSLRLVGLHFHVDGYAAADRAVAVGQALDLVDAARSHGHAPAFVDIGGGIPMSYLDDPAPWDEFWARHPDGALTWEGRALGTVYPVWQRPVRGSWLGEVLETVLADGCSVAEGVRRRGLRLHVEPGRSLLDGCGLTVARVEHRKQRPDGSWLIGLAMNRTQCRSAADDFLVDPVLVPAPGAVRTPAGEGFLVGAYCIEAELLTWRRLRFPGGVAVGDLVVWVNTAGYQMHILESASHQIPLARNLAPASDGGWALDDIDR